MNRFNRAVFSILLPLLTGCIDQMAGTTSTGNTGKGTIAGRVLGPDGNAAANARVSVVEVDHNPGPGGTGEVAAIAVTDSDGSFRTDSLPDGIYNLLDAKGGQVAFVDSIVVAHDSAAHAREAALGAPGSVTGVVRLRPGHDSRTVFLVLIGTTTFSVPKDSIGNFALTGLAEGEYRLRVLSTLDAYDPLDTLIRVRAGKETRWTDTLRLKYRAANGLPLIDAPKLEYDSALLAVKVSWAKGGASGIAAYNVYRRARDSAFVLLTRSPDRDTFFVDGVDGGLLPGRTYEYAVTALDASGNEGLKGQASALFPSPLYRIDTLSTVPCRGFDVDRSGTVWLLDTGGVMRKIPPTGTASDWPGFRVSANGVLVDTAGSFYFFVGGQTPGVVKYDSSGAHLWEARLPEAGMAFSNGFRLSGDTLLLWNINTRTLVYLSLDGTELGKETVLQGWPASYPGNFPDFRPETGFFLTLDSELVLINRDGKDSSGWELAPHGYIRDLTRDADGRWYLARDGGRIEVYSPDRRLLETILVKSPSTLLFRNGALYTLAAGNLLRIRTGL